MNRYLTQPEEIDKILIEIAGQNMKAGAPNRSGMQANPAAYDFACD